ncbi:MAG: MFS transporter [Eubacteriaceae bacterium]|nr:MFS transporter [Eubacteriaceae bacterium]
MEKKKLSPMLVNSYALGQGALTMAFTVPTMFLTVFMTDYLGIDPIALGTGMGIAKALDFIISIVAGGIIEKVEMKHGKYMSWIRLLTITLFFGNVVQMIDTSAFVGNSTMRLVIVCVFYVMFHGSMNFNATARAAMIPKLAGADMEARQTLTSRQAQVGAATAIISSAITLPSVQLVEKLTGSPSLGYGIVTLVFSLVFVGCNLLFIKEAQPYDPPTMAGAAKKQSPTVKQMISSVFTNKQMIVIFLGFTIFTVGTQLYTGLTAYYFRVTDNYSFMTVATTSRSICAFLASMVIPKFAKKFGKKMSLVIGWTLYGVGLLGIWALAMDKDAGTANLAIMTVLMCFCQVAMYMYTPFMANYYLDCGEYGYYTTGVDNRTMAVTVMNWPTKIGFAVGGTLIGFALSWAGYTVAPGATIGTFASVSMFMNMFALVPAIACFAAAAWIFVFYKLTDEEAAMYAKANAEREAQKNA